MRKLKHSLRHSNHLLGDGLARSFVRALAELLGGYRAGLHRSSPPLPPPARSADEGDG